MRLLILRIIAGVTALPAGATMTVDFALKGKVIEAVASALVTAGVAGFFVFRRAGPNRTRIDRKK